MNIVRKRVLVAYGTRPEAVKMAPLIRELQKHPDIGTSVLVTGQHREMLAQVHKLFGVTADMDLDIMTPGQTLSEIFVKTLEGTSTWLRAESADVVVVQGDTSSALAVALAAYYLGSPVAHVEAGLRSGNIYSPHPEEGNRRLISQLASLHFAPTDSNRDNLIAEGVPDSAIAVTGNTAIDALIQVLGDGSDVSIPEIAGAHSAGRSTVLVTAHRRESWGEPMVRIGAAVAELANGFPAILFVVPTHMNPVVREPLRLALEGLENVFLTGPLDYRDFCTVMGMSKLVLTDSGGVQEEAPSLGVPVLVMRENTERPEGVAAGTVELVGTTTESITARARHLLSDEVERQRMAKIANPYGDGHAAPRIVRALRQLLALP